MEALSELYGPDILAHVRAPVGVGLPSGATHRSERRNAWCGDQLRLGLVLESSVIRDLGYDVRGCALTLASASILASSLNGSDHCSARYASEALLQALRSDSTGWPRQLEQARSLAMVRRFPERVGCVALPWQALIAALDDHATD